MLALFVQIPPPPFNPYFLEARLKTQEYHPSVVSNPGNWCFAISGMHQLFGNLFNRTLILTYILLFKHLNPKNQNNNIRLFLTQHLWKVYPHKFLTSLNLSDHFNESSRDAIGEAMSTCNLLKDDDGYFQQQDASDFTDIIKQRLIEGLFDLTIPEQKQTLIKKWLANTFSGSSIQMDVLQLNGSRHILEYRELDKNPTMESVQLPQPIPIRSIDSIKNYFIQSQGSQSFQWLSSSTVNHMEPNQRNWDKQDFIDKKHATVLQAEVYSDVLPNTFGFSLNTNLNQSFGRLKNYEPNKLTKIPYTLSFVPRMSDQTKLPQVKTYYLNTILAKSGTSNGGHWVAYVAADMGNTWLKLDDATLSIHPRPTKAWLGGKWATFLTYSTSKF
jgi:hypothetical protein